MPGVTSIVAAIALLASVAWAEPSCPGTASVSLFARNVSGVSPVVLTVEGERAADAVGCVGGGAASYHETVECSGSGIVSCGRIAGLAPGSWVHRVSLSVPGSEPQVQAQRSVLLAGQTVAVSNALLWTVYPRTFVVRSAAPDDPQGGLQMKLDEAAQYTAANDGPVLVTFSALTFPGAVAPKRIYLVDPTRKPPCAIAARNHCPPTGTLADPTAGLCFTGNRIVVDGLDLDARAGGVVLSVGTCARAVVRVSGGDNVLRGLVIEGSQAPSPASQLDVLAITGPGALRNLLEQSTIRGATSGDAVTVASGAIDNLIVASEITGAKDKGVKVVDGSAVRIERSCLHDNFDGGVQLTTSDPTATVGGSVVAIENVVQHNVGGGAQHGFIVGVEGKQIETHLETRGNVVRFNGARGVSISNEATADLANDVVSDNYRAGLRIRTTLAGAAPVATVRGGMFACNYAPGYCVNSLGAATGSVCRLDADCGRCVGGTEQCRQDGDCPSGRLCAFDVCKLEYCGPARCGTNICCPATSVSTGAGLAFDKPCLDCSTPTVDLGTVDDAGANAFTRNVNVNATGTGITPGINMSAGLTAVVPAEGNQWEHCGEGCSVAQVLAADVRVVTGATPPSLGTPMPSHAGPAPVVTAVSPPRPRAGDLVRVYGGPFDAIAGADCSPSGLPADPCSAANANVAARNAGDPARGNRVAIALDGVTYDAPVHQVTPAMLVFAMPVDCDAPGTITLARGSQVGLPAALCDPKGCADRPAGAPCDDGDACTLDDHCDGAGGCAAGAPRECAAPCLECDPAVGCVPKPLTAACDDRNVCTLGDHCSGESNTCVPFEVLTCASACLTGACDPEQGCVRKAQGTTCRDGAGPCDVAETCDGASPDCPADVFRAADGVCRAATGPCDVTETCTGTGPDCPPDAFAPAVVSCDDASACTTNDHCSGTADACTGTPVVCDQACLTGVCDPGLGCVARDGASALTCRVDECAKARLHRKVRKLGVIIDNALEQGKTPKARRVARLRTLLTRCGVEMPR